MSVHVLSKWAESFTRALKVFHGSENKISMLNFLQDKIGYMESDSKSPLLFCFGVI